MRKVAARRGKSVSDMEVRLTFVKPRYLMGEHIPTIRDVDLGTGFIREPVKYKK